MSASLFDLTGEALALQRQIDAAAADLFSDDPAVVAAATATLETLISAEADNRKAVETKADAWCWVIDHIRAQAAARAAHAQRLKDLAATAELQADVLQDRLIHALSKIDSDATKWELPNHRITSRRVTAVEVLVDAYDLPERFQRVRTTYSPDKTALTAALKTGAQIEGAMLTERRSWSIK